MFISVSKVNDRYAFLVGDNAEDPPRMFLRSMYDFDLMPHTSSVYDTFGEAHLAANKLVCLVPSAILARKVVAGTEIGEGSDIPPEDRATSHFGEQVKILEGRLDQASTAPEEDRVEAIQAFLKEVGMVKDSIKSMTELIEGDENRKDLVSILSDLACLEERAKKMGGTKTAAVGKDGRPAWRTDFILSMSEEVMRALTPVHKDIRIERIDEDRDTGGISCLMCDAGGDVCRVVFSEECLLTGVFPSERVGKEFPYHSVGFMERYWEPTVAAVGHIMVPGTRVVAQASGPTSSRRDMDAWDIESNRPCRLRIKEGPGGKAKTWILSVAQCSQVDREAASQPDNLIGRRARCIKKTLPSYYNREGQIKNVRRLPDHLEFSIDFLRGLGVLVLKDSDVTVLPAQ